MPPSAGGKENAAPGGEGKSQKAAAGAVSRKRKLDDENAESSQSVRCALPAQTAH
jgi:hypothetical protein